MKTDGSLYPHLPTLPSCTDLSSVNNEVDVPSSPGLRPLAWLVGSCTNLPSPAHHAPRGLGPAAPTASRGSLAFARAVPLSRAPSLPEPRLKLQLVWTAALQGNNGHHRVLGLKTIFSFQLMFFSVS